MKQRLLSDYGMVLVLLLLCGTFSVVTTSEQSPTGEAAAKQVAAAIGGEYGREPRVLVVAGDQPGDDAFAARLDRELAAMGARVLKTVTGGPKEARDALVEIAGGGGTIDAIACTQTAGKWLVFSDLATDFPTVGTPRLVVPRSYRWPNFLKAENLLNIANQIAVIAIIAIGMTMVIITGGIDLSVGSLLALSAVVADSQLMSADFCHSSCRSTGALYFAVRNGRECYCGTNYGDGSLFGYGGADPLGCAMACSGNWKSPWCWPPNHRFCCWMNLWQAWAPQKQNPWSPCCIN